MLILILIFFLIFLVLDEFYYAKEMLKPHEAARHQFEMIETVLNGLQFCA